MDTALTQAFAPVQLTIEDESARHAGHSGAKEGGQTHYRVVLVSEKFTNLSRVQRSQLVHSALTGEFNDGLHALSLSLRSPDEM